MRERERDDPSANTKICTDTIVSSLIIIRFLMLIIYDFMLLKLDYMYLYSVTFLRVLRFKQCVESHSSMYCVKHSKSSVEMYRTVSAIIKVEILK